MTPSDDPESGRRDPEALLLQHTEDIKRRVAWLGRHLPPQEIEDLYGWVILRLIEDDYALIRKYRGESTFRTYLHIVVSSLFRDYRAREWGRWRPSAAAKREGEVGIQLEFLLYKGCSLQEAGRILRSSGVTNLSDRELAELAGRLPTRGPLRPVDVGPDPLEGTAGAQATDADLLAAELAAKRKAVWSALARAVERLGFEEQTIIRLLIWERRTVAQIARGLGLEQKPLYRRIEQILRRLRADLVGEGISAVDVRELLGEYEE